MVHALLMKKNAVINMKNNIVTQQNGYWIVEMTNGELFEWSMEKALKRIPVLKLFDKKSLARITTIRIPDATDQTKA
jgi:hypothetical protein